MIVLVVVGLASTAAVTMSKSSGQTVLVESDGELYGKYSLFEDNRIVVERTSDSGKKLRNTVIIKDGKVRVTDSTCANQVCVKHSEIDQSGESIICLPNKLVVKIKGKGGDKYDTVSS